MTDFLWNINFAKVREGEVCLDNGNHELYKCPEDKWTIGYGWNLEDNGLPERFALDLLNYAVTQSQQEVIDNVKEWHSLCPARKSVLTDMCYNMGWTRLSKFKKMFAAIKSKDWSKAAAEMKDSRWYDQVGIRAHILCKMMETGQYPD